MIKYKMHQRVEMLTTVDEIICDWCGKNFFIHDAETGFDFPCGGTIKLDFGYGSRFDSLEPEEYSGDICDDCFELHLKKFVRKEKKR